MTDAPITLAEDDSVRVAKAATARAILERLRARAARSEDAENVVETAAAQIGDGYAWGGTGPDAFDCSGLTAYVYADAGVSLPHTSHGQAAMGRPVDRDEIRPADLVFFSTAGPGASHVGIAIGENTVVSATNSGVMKHSMDDAYWGGHYVGARRVL